MLEIAIIVAAVFVGFAFIGVAVALYIVFQDDGTAGDG